MNQVTTYSYTEDIAQRDVSLGVTVLTYSAPGVSDIQVGVSLPRGSQTMDDVAKQFAPLGYWSQQLNPVVVPDGPVSGTVQIQQAPPVPAQTVPSTPNGPATAVPRDFLARFTQQEQAAIFSAAVTNPAVMGLVINLAAAQEIVFSDPAMNDGMNLLVSLGLITHDRSLEILPASVRSTGVTVL